MPPRMTLHRFREGGKGRSSRFTRKRRGRRTFFSLFLPGDDEEGKHSEDQYCQRRTPSLPIGENPLYCQDFTLVLHAHLRLRSMWSSIPYCLATGWQHSHCLHTKLRPTSAAPSWELHRQGTPTLPR